MIKLPKHKKVFVMSNDECDDDINNKSKDVGVMQLNTNQVFFYDDVTRFSIFNLNRSLDITTKNLQSLKINYNLPSVPELDLFINSEGGEIFSAFSAVDKILASPVNINTYVEGIAASAATLLSVCGHRRYIRKNSFMLIHQVSSGLWGSFAEFKEEVKNLEMIMKYIKSIYLKKTKFTDDELNDILKHDLYLNAEECLKFGLVDEIV
jgi:ATP-dependent protease ClpP protease subunit